MTNDLQALGQAADAENAAVFTYGVTTAFIGPAARRAVVEYIAAHRVQRDQVNAVIVAAGGTEHSAAAGYVLPIEVTDTRSAATVLLQAENDTARAYRVLAEEGTTTQIRRLAVDGLTACALRAAHWRGVLRESPTTTAFPGA